MKKIFFFVVLTLCILIVNAQDATTLVQQVRSKLEMVNDYQANGKMKTNVVFIKAPVANVKVYYKKPDKMRIVNETGISFIPKGAVNINLNNVFLSGEGYDVIDAGKSVNGLRIIKLLPKSESSDIVLSTLYIDEKQLLINRSTTTTKENGTYELEMFYGKYSAYGLPDKIVFSFNTKDFKLPKGVTLDYDDGSRKNNSEALKNKKGKVEISYSNYIINKGINNAVFKG
ncbi:MAG: hypothetical protein C4329_04705 [Chitinophagaceae bacterium]